MNKEGKHKICVRPEQWTSAKVNIMELETKKKKNKTLIEKLYTLFISSLLFMSLWCERNFSFKLPMPPAEKCVYEWKIFFAVLLDSNGCDTVV